MDNNIGEMCISTMYELYPFCRKLVLDTFDKKKDGVTKTQQIILLALAAEEKLTMSQLASKIKTSNEQATRAVAQLVNRDFVERMHDSSNRRVINIRLTERARSFIKQLKADVAEEITEQFKNLSDEDMEKFCNALGQITDILKKTENSLRAKQHL